MIKLSTKGRYAARLMLELAGCYGKKALRLKDIAASQEISEGYLEHIVPRLLSAGLICSRGRGHGGYMLARDPAEITLGNIMRAMSNEINLVACVRVPKLCRRSATCVMRDVWSEVNEKFSGMLDAITLGEMRKRQQQKIAG